MKIGCKQKSMQVSSVTGSRHSGLGGAAQLAQAQQPMTVVGVGETVAVAVRVGVAVWASASPPAVTTSMHTSVRTTVPPVRQPRPPTRRARR